MRKLSLWVIGLLVAPSLAAACPLVETPSDELLVVAQRGVELPALEDFEIPETAEPSLPDRVHVEPRRVPWTRPPCFGPRGPSPDRSFIIRAEIPAWEETAVDRGWIRESGR